MAVYSDLLFTVGGDPIDVRASIYEIIFILISFFKEKVVFSFLKESKDFNYFNYI